MSVAQTETETKETHATEDAPMVLLSDKAAEKVKEIRGEENIEEGYALRLKVQGGGCSGFSYDLYFEDKPTDMDDRPSRRTASTSTSTRSATSTSTAPRLTTSKASTAPGFKFDNPNVKAHLRLRQLV